MRKVIGFCLVLAGLSSTALAVPRIPEIDPGSMVSAMTVLSCGLLVFADRRRSK